ncbi:DUF4879 domain-containing protein [Luteibacter sp. 9135]|uniref:DUF4879 domain-containing protein n=1 Tax=Luteibacter sp. 9135 TaxID=1500893 RepID=UPI0009DDA652
MDHGGAWMHVVTDDLGYGHNAQATLLGSPLREIRTDPLCNVGGRAAPCHGRGTVIGYEPLKVAHALLYAHAYLCRRRGGGWLRSERVRPLAAAARAQSVTTRRLVAAPCERPQLRLRESPHLHAKNKKSRAISRPALNH